MPESRGNTQVPYYSPLNLHISPFLFSYNLYLHRSPVNGWEFYRIMRLSTSRNTTLMNHATISQQKYNLDSRELSQPQVRYWQKSESRCNLFCHKGALHCSLAYLSQYFFFLFKTLTNTFHEKSCPSPDIEK